MHPSLKYEVEVCLLTIIYAVFRGFPSLIVLVSLDHGAVYTVHLTVRTIFGPMCVCQSTLGDRASEQLHRHNQDSISSW
jgi:hypothetical protein